MDIASVHQFARNSARFREVVSILAKYGLAEWLGPVRSDWLQDIFRDSSGTLISDLSPNQRVRYALTELGTTFIKLGQVLSTRPDLVGPELALELTELQSNTPADSFEYVSQLVQDELGHAPSEIFAEFDQQPLASASIGQVHRASTNDGKKVIVKIQHEGIEGRVQNDLEILHHLAGIAEDVSPASRQYQPVKTAQEFADTLRQEMDFSREAGNLKRFAHNFAKDDHICIPGVYDGHSSRRVLTMDFLEGISVSHKNALIEANHDLTKLAEQGARMFVDMIFRDGFCHADPHPGNLLVLEDGSIGLLDCGMVLRINDGLREQVEDMALAAVGRDSRTLTSCVMKMGQVPQGTDELALASELDDFLSDYAEQSVSDFDLSGALNGMIRIIRDHQIVLPAKIGMLIKILVMLEGTAQQLDPQFSLAELLSGYKEQAIRRRLEPKRLLGKLQTEARQWTDLAERFPRDAADILNRIKNGSFDVHLDHRRLDSIVNRLVVGILAAALFVGSASLWSRDVSPHFKGVSIPGALGCATAIWLGFKLIRAVKRSGDLDGES